MSVFDKNSSVGLREKYNHAIQTAKSLHMDGGADERNGKLYFNGAVNSVDEKNQIWNALKTVPDWDKEVVAYIKVKATAAQSSAAGPTSHQAAAATPTLSYTVQSGDTLSALARKFLGSANDYMDIFNANRDQLTDPDKIRPGQVLKIPQPTHK